MLLFQLCSEVKFLHLKFADIVAVNILTVLEKAEKEYPGLLEIHRRLSESAHPNFDGVVYGYSSSDPINYETNFHNRWFELYGT